MTLTLVFALDAEWSAWRKRHGFRRLAGEPLSIYESTVDAVRVRVAICGIGAPAVGPLIDVACSSPVDAVAVVGLAGALTSNRGVGDFVASGEARAGTSGVAVACDKRLVALATACGAVAIDAVVSLDHVVSHASEKAILAAHGDVVDMESFAVLSESRRRGIPGVSIRVIGDSVDENLPLDFTGAIRPDGTLNSAHLLGQAVTRPGRWPAVAAFAIRQRRVLVALADFLDRFVHAFGQKHEWAVTPT